MQIKLIIAAAIIMCLAVAAGYFLSPSVKQGITPFVPYVGWGGVALLMLLALASRRGLT